MKNKDHLVRSVSDKTKTPLYVVTEIVDALLESIREELCAGNQVGIRKFGTFNLLTRTARTGTNPRNGNPVDIPEKLRVKFSAGKTFTELLNKDLK